MGIWSNTFVKREKHWDYWIWHVCLDKNWLAQMACVYSIIFIFMSTFIYSINFTLHLLHRLSNRRLIYWISNNCRKSHYVHFNVYLGTFTMHLSALVKKAFHCERIHKKCWNEIFQIFFLSFMKNVKILGLITFGRMHKVTRRC